MKTSFSTSVIAAMAVFINTCSAVVVCSGYNSATGGCIGTTCQEYFIAFGDTINIQNTNCIYNSASDGGFDLQVCTGSDLSGTCKGLNTFPNVIIDGYFNWHVSNVKSIKRTGN